MHLIFLNKSNFFHNKREDYHMRNLFTHFLLTAVVMTFMTVSSTDAQLNEYGLKFGVQAHGAIPITDFKELDFNSSYKISYLFRPYLRFKLTNALDAEFGAGYGSLSGLDVKYEDFWNTKIIPIDARLVLNPFDMENWNPYVYAGVGVMTWWVTNQPKQGYLDSPFIPKKDGWAFIVPFGAGMEVKLSESMLLDFSAGLTYSTTDHLNFFNNFENDGSYDWYGDLGLGLTYYSESGSSDKDGDGLTLDQEEELGTNPRVADTDGDGLTDGEEVKTYNTDPLAADSDNDGSNDGDEVKNLKTDPNKADTDGDGLSDYAEYFTHKTDPLKTDTDGDMLSDGDEVNKYKTDPSKADTDLDKLSDGDEVNKYKTNPLSADTDGDGLKDYDELMTYKTNPNAKDSDKGTVNDGVEVDRGTDPLNAEDDIIKIDAPIVLEGVTFASGKATLTDNSETILKTGVLKTLNTYKDIKVEIRGYTDNVGRRTSNIKLSQKRADAVKLWLIDHGIDASRLTAVGYGPDNPVAPNTSKEGKEKNRRIEFVRVAD